MNKKNHPFGSGPEAIIFASLLLLIMWLMHWAQHLFDYDFYKLGILPKTKEGIKGILFMPLVHSQTDFKHILNNSIPIFLLLTSLIYYYRPIAWQVFLFGWLMTGSFLWVFAENKSSYHIGMSGVIYMLSAFLFTSGTLRRYLPLQAISLFIVFIYGSMIWGIFPMEEKVSWEGHFSGFVSGILLAFLYRKKGPQRPKYLYEIEKEMGIEPPDFESEYLEKLSKLEEEKKSDPASQLQIIYHFKPNDPAAQPQDEKSQ